MRKFVVIPFTRYMTEMGDQRGSDVCQMHSHHSRVAQITNPTSPEDYSSAINNVTDNRPILVNDQQGGNLPPKPPSKETIKKFATGRKMKAVTKRLVPNSDSKMDKHYNKKKKWIKF